MSLHLRVCSVGHAQMFAGGLLSSQGLPQTATSVTNREVSIPQWPVPAFLPRAPVIDNGMTTSSPDPPGHSNRDLIPHHGSWKASAAGPGPATVRGRQVGWMGPRGWQRLAPPAVLSLCALGPVPGRSERARLGFLPIRRLQDRQTASVAAHRPRPGLGWAGWKPGEPHGFTSALLYWTTSHKAHPI